MGFFKLSIFVPMARGHMSEPFIVTKDKKKKKNPTCFYSAKAFPFFPFFLSFFNVYNALTSCLAKPYFILLLFLICICV